MSDALERLANEDMTLRVGGHWLLSIRRDRWALAASALGLATNSMSAEFQAEFVDANVLV
jgi:hypothetical protein